MADRKRQRRGDTAKRFNDEVEKPRTVPQPAAVKKHVRNPTRVVPEKAGFETLSRDEIKHDLKEVLQTMDNTDSEDEDRETIITSMRPPLAPESGLLHKKRRYFEWASNPTAINIDMQAYRNVVYVLYSQLQRIETESCTFEESSQRIRRDINTFISDLKRKNQQLETDGDALLSLFQTTAPDLKALNIGTLLEMLEELDEDVRKKINEYVTLCYNTESAPNITESSVTYTPPIAASPPTEVIDFATLSERIAYHQQRTDILHDTPPNTAANLSPHELLVKLFEDDKELIGGMSGRYGRRKRNKEIARFKVTPTMLVSTPRGEPLALSSASMLPERYAGKFAGIGSNSVTAGDAALQQEPSHNKILQLKAKIRATESYLQRLASATAEMEQQATDSESALEALSSLYDATTKHYTAVVEKGLSEEEAFASAGLAEKELVGAAIKSTRTTKTTRRGGKKPPRVPALNPINLLAAVSLGRDTDSAVDTASAADDTESVTYSVSVDGDEETKSTTSAAAAQKNGRAQQAKKAAARRRRFFC